MIVSPYESLGCWKDSIPRALTSIDATVAKKHGHYKSRSHPLQNCLEAAKDSGHKFFALQDGGQCFGSKDSTAYKKYGDSTACSDGKGGPMANSVYGVRIGKMFLRHIFTIPPITLYVFTIMPIISM